MAIASDVRFMEKMCLDEIKEREVRAVEEHQMEDPV